MRGRLTWWVAVAGVALLVAPGAVAIEAVDPADGGGGHEGDEAEQAAVIGAGTDPQRVGAAGPTTTSTSSTPPATTPSGASQAGASGNGSGERCNPYCTDLDSLVIPPPQSVYDPYANCPNRWQVEQSTGRLVDTGCASEPIEPVTIETVPPSTLPPPVLLPQPPTTTTSTPPPPPPTTTPPPPTTMPPTTVP